MSFRTIVISAVLATATVAFAQTTTTTATTACSTMSLGTMGALNGFVPSPNDAWHQDITSATVDPESATIISTVGDLGGTSLHPDFGAPSGTDYYGIPYTVVDSSQTPGVPMPITLYPSESDITLYPFSTGIPVEGNPAACPTDSGDRHAIVIDRHTCVAYETYKTGYCNSAWSAGSSAVWDLTESEKRPYGMTSTDAAGLSVFEGLVRYDEIVAGVINHAIRFTAKNTKDDANNGYFMAPATHAAGNLWGTDNIMGMRIRLKADFDISKFSATNQIILKAMKQYGMILADNGSTMFFQGTPDSRWNNTDLNALKAIASSNFDVIQMGPTYDETTEPKGAAPVITAFTAEPATVAEGGTVTLTPTVTDASYSYIDKAGYVRDSITVNPSATTTYTLTSRNAYGSATKSVTVTVQGAGGLVTPQLVLAAVPAKTFGVAAFSLSATSKSPAPIVYSVVSGPGTVSGSKVTLTGIGTVIVEASQAATATYSDASTTTFFAVGAGIPGLAFAAVPAQSYGGTPITLSTTTKSYGSIAYSIVSGPATIAGNVVTTTGVGTVSLLATQAAAGNYAAATATTTFAVAAAKPTLNFTAIASRIFSTTKIYLTSTSNSYGAKTYSVVSGPATVSAGVATLTGVGTVTLQVAQAAYGGYAAATATTSFDVTGVTPKLTLTSIASKPATTAPFAVTATSTSTGAITYSIVSGPAQVSGNTVTVTGPGTVSVQASQAALGSYASATTTTSFTVTGSVSALTFAPIAAQVYGTSFTVSATSPSAAPISYSLVSGPATVLGNRVTVTGVGTVVLRATQAAQGSYAAASVTTSVATQAATPTITIAPIPDRTYSTLKTYVEATSNSWGAKTFSVVSGPATLLGSTVTVTGTGAVTVRVAQAAYGDYAAGSSDVSFNILAPAVK